MYATLVESYVVTTTASQRGHNVSPTAKLPDNFDDDNFDDNMNILNVAILIILVVMIMMINLERIISSDRSSCSRPLTTFSNNLLTLLKNPL